MLRKVMQERVSSGRAANILAVVLALSAAVPANASSISFCEFGESIFFSEKMVIDTDKKVAIGSDTRSSLLPLVNSEVVGFESPFPLVVPKKGNYVEEWSSLKYKYDFLTEVESDWIVVLASPIGSDGNYTKSTTLFSKSDGVIALSISRTFEEETYTANFFRCSVEPLFPEELLTK